LIFTRRTISLLGLTALLLAGVFPWAGAVQAADPAQQAVIARGAVLFAAAGCANCHTDRAHHGLPLAGGRAIVTGFGTFYTPNISPDPRFGIGGWSDRAFISALREGVAPDGSDYYPAFPYPSFTEMSDDDLLAIKRYIFSLPPQQTPDRPQALRFPFNIRTGIKLWKVLYLREGPLTPSPDESPEWNRGAYLARAVVHCGECHTPRNLFGAMDTSRRYAGVSGGPDAMNAPDITPDPHALGSWSTDDIASFLDDGMTPSGDSTGGAMAEVIHGTSLLSAADRRAIAVYLKTQIPIAPQPGLGGQPGG